ncbi:MAG: metallophosphoesterase [Bacteroidetes bacterium]|nr:metallophosphoesterase [Bacteroidota bacterium]
MKRIYLLSVLIMLGFSISATSQTTIIAKNSSWKYISNGANQGTAWRATAFNDAAWSTGNAELGYGDGGEATVLSYGPSSSSKYVTYYFRKSFTISNPAQYSALTLNILRDDGAVIYLNGTEVARSNMPSGTINYTTLASTAVGATDESTYYPYTISSSLLVAGTNVLAVEIHQNSKTSPDLSFNCSLTSTNVVLPTVVVTRGPYLQSVTSNSIIVRWRTDVNCDSKVFYGTGLTYGNSKVDAAPTKEHSVKITGLSPATKYYYSIGTTTATLQGNSANYFKTAPLIGASTPVRIWATGDFGTGTATQAAVRDAFVNYSVSTPADMWLWMGDNAYAAGYDKEYQNFVFNIYPNQFKNIPVFPCLGNHDYANVGYQSASALGTNFPYFSIFTVPTTGEAGGLASGTAKYYSYNYANIHFIALDSYGALNGAGSPMYTWLQNDLAANTQTWTVVYFHHPPYSKGTHNSDTETEMINMRQNIVPLLESYHVDLVLNGHSHSNERSYLIKGHYGIANTFTSAMKMSTSANNFVKTTPFNGTVYAVCGTSGQNVGGISAGWPMSCMNFNNNTNNTSLVMDVSGNTFVCKYLSSLGTIVDQFTITKVVTQARESKSEYKIYQSEERIVLDVATDEPSLADLSFYSIDGKIMQQFTSLELNPQSKLYFSKGTFSMPTGIYIAVLTSNKQRYSQKLFLNF